MLEFRARYFDGSSSAPSPAAAVLAPAGMYIGAADGVRDWPYAQLALLEEVHDGRPVRVRSPAGGDARLVVEDARFFAALLERAPHLRRFDQRGLRPAPAAAAWTAGVAAAIAAVYFGLPILAEPVAAVMPLAWEEKLGADARQTFLAQIRMEGRECAAPEGVAALERITARLSITMPSRYNWRVAVVDNGEENAVNLPGGYIVFFRGLIDRADSGEAVAGVLAHEMGHGIERHGVEGLLGTLVVKALLSVFAGDSSRWAGIAGDVALRSHSRASERQADRIGVEMLNRADIRAAPFAAWFRRLASEYEKTSANSYVSTHPPSVARAVDVEARATGKGDAMSAADWQALRAICTVRR